MGWEKEVSWYEGMNRIREVKAFRIRKLNRIRERGDWDDGMSRKKREKVFG